MGNHQFGCGKTEAGHILNFLGIPSAKSFVSNKIHEIKMFLGKFQEEVKKPSLNELFEKKFMQFMKNKKMLGSIQNGYQELDTISYH